MISMARSRASAKKAGTAFETAIASYLTERLDLPVSRMPKSGAVDKGDIKGVSIGGVEVAVECKNPGQRSTKPIAGWWAETEVEAANIGTGLGFLVVSVYRKPIGKSLVVVYETMLEKLLHGEDLDFDVELQKSTGFDQWVLDGYTEKVLKVPRRGYDGFWYVLDIDRFCNVLDSAEGLTTVTMDNKLIEELKIKGALTIPSSDGKSVRIVYKQA